MPSAPRISHRLAPSLGSLAEQCYASAYNALASNDIDEARHLFWVLTALEPRAERAWVGLSVCHERDGRTAAAATLYGIGAHVTGKTSPWLALGRARTLRALGRIQESGAAFDAAEQCTEDPSIAAAIEEERCQ
jgi:thioredoxin-like negative regulator of GroEL